MATNYWWVTRPKRKLNTVPEVLAAFCNAALGKKWTGNREAHIAFEEELENSGTKRVGERRDASGSGGRTYGAWLYSLGLWFEKDGKVFLTLAGEAIMNGKPPVPVLTKQVLHYQYPSVYSKTVGVSPRFKIRPFIFLLRLLLDSRIKILKQEEIAYIIAIHAENESDACYEKVVSLIRDSRAYGWNVFGPNYFQNYNASSGNLQDIANTMMNWLEYTQLIYREQKIIGIPDDKRKEVEDIVDIPMPFINATVEPDVFQRKYGVDPWHQKDTRNLINTSSISSATIDKNRILRAFFNYSSVKPVKSITSDVVDYISDLSGTEYKFAEEVLLKTYPNGALGGYLSNYRNMAFQGREEAVDFELATTNLFQDVFGYQAIHLGQTGAKSTPDILLISDPDGYQAIIDNKAYSNYSITGDHHNRMVHNYIQKISNYSECQYPIGFFTYISGGFAERIDSQIQNEVSASGVHGSGITVDTFIALIEKHEESSFTHQELRNIFGMDRQILLSDIHH